MSEIWNNNSEIEEKNSRSITPLLGQLNIRFSMRDFDEVLKRLYNKQNIDESDYIIIKYFLIGNYKEKYEARYAALIEYASEDLKKIYTIDRIKALNIENVDADFISSLFSGSLTPHQKDIAYNLLLKDNTFLEDKLIDDRVRTTLKNNITSEFIAAKIEKEINKEKENPLSGTELMNDELKNEILNSIPSDYTKLEQSIYLYIKLCQTFSYDGSYYVNKNLFISQHEEFSNLKKITAQNPSVVCYEFVTIYAELLEKIGIKSNVSTSFWCEADENDKLVVDSFRDNHASLVYNVDNIIISADSTNSILNGDLINAKMGNRLNGLICKNVNEEDKLTFESALEKVYSNTKLNDDLKKYDKEILELPLTERLKKLFDEITNINVQGVDFISYITYLKHRYFSEDELQWNVVINYVGKNDGETLYPVVIFSINTNDILNVGRDTVQYLYDTKSHQLIKYDNQELQKLFQSELFKLEETEKIPGIKIGKEK